MSLDFVLIKLKELEDALEHLKLELENSENSFQRPIILSEHDEQVASWGK